MKACTEWAEESYKDCSRYEDRGYSSCDDWDSKCCKWWPCSWGCKLITWVCMGWVWISNVVCVAWTTLTTLVCITWEVLVVLATPLAVILEWVLSIPIIGRIIKEILNLVHEIVARLIGLGDAFLTLIGIRLLKKIRLCIVILRDPKGVATATPASLQGAITAAEQIFRDEANIEIIVEGIHTVDGPSPDYVLDVGCNADAWGEDLWLPGSWFEATAAWHCPTGAVGRVTGINVPIVAFAVREIPGSTAGCALGPLTDYLTIEGGSPLCLAHEMAHKVGLWHCCPGTNLANGSCGGTTIDWWQRVIVRNSKYVTYI